MPTSSARLRPHSPARTSPMSCAVASHTSSME
nr:MAG TPA: hypothetical protein [Caudoviricetes sp.]